MSSRRYTDEYKAEAVKQVVERGHAVVDVAARLGINKHSLYDWIQKSKRAAPKPVAEPSVGGTAEERRLRAELKRVTEERDILKKAAAYFARG
jgi:transposase